MKLRRFRPRFRLRTRIFLGFGVLIALLLGIAAFGSYGLSLVGAEIDVMDGIAGNANRQQELVLRLEVVRRGLADYRIDAGKDSLNEVVEAEARAAALLKESAQYTLSEQRRAMFNGVAEKLRSFVTMRERFVALRDSAASERSTLFADGNALRAAVKRLADATLASGDSADEARLIAVRLATQDVETTGARFIAAADPNLVAEFRNDRAAAAQALPALDGSAAAAVRAAAPAVASALTRYAADFDKMSATMTEADALYGEHIRPDMRDLQAVAGKALDRLIKGFDSTSQKAADISADTLTKQLGLSGGATLIGIILAFLIGRGIVRPLTAMTGVINKLAAGDSSIAVPARDNKDEIGDMARAVEVFRQNAVDAERLTAEQA